jgi:hypothetical protein
MELKVKPPQPAQFADFDFKQFCKIVGESYPERGKGNGNETLYRSAMDALCRLIRQAYRLKVGEYQIITNGYGEFKHLKIGNDVVHNQLTVFKKIKPLFLKNG